MLVDKNNRCPPQMLKRSQKHKTSTQEQLCTKSRDPLGIREIQMRTQGLRDNCPQHIGCKHLFFDNWFRAFLACFLLLFKEICPFQARPQRPYRGSKSTEFENVFLFFIFSPHRLWSYISPTLIPSPHTYTCFSIDVTQ